MLGQLLRTEEKVFTVVGVMPAGFERWRGAADLWLPLDSQDDFEKTRNSPGYFLYRGIGRLRAGVSHEAARADLEPLLGAAEREAGNARGVNILSLRNDVVSVESRRLIAFLSITVALVWMIACANVGGLLIARNMDRAPELAIRVAMGAGSWRIARQISAESLVLALAGAALGVAVAEVAVRGLLTYGPPALARPDLIRWDTAAVLTVAGLVILTAAAMSIVPTLQISTGRLQASLQEGRVHSTRGRQTSRVQDAMVFGEIAIAVFVLICTALVVRSFGRLQQVDLGFQAGEVLTFRLSLPASYTGERLNHVHEDLRSRLAVVPGVRAVTLASDLPTDPSDHVSIRLDDGRRFLNSSPADRPFTPGLHLVGPGYFRTIGARLVRGREFTDADRAGSLPVVMTNEAMARALWPDQNPIGRRIAYNLVQRVYVWYEIVGIVRNIRYAGPETPAKPEMYLPLAQGQRSDVVVLLEASSDAAARFADARTEVARFDADIPIYGVKTLATAAFQRTAEPRYRAAMMSALGCLAILLTAGGLYALLSGRVARRRRELAIRIAIGADPAGLTRLVIRQAIGLLAPATVCGTIAAALSTQWLANQLFGVSPWDMTAFTCGIVGLVVTGLLAAYIPARRAARIDPMIALRAE